MKTRHLILTLLKELGGRINSKTELQKEIYFLSILIKKELSYRAHLYGPYSNDVENGLDELLGAGFINESCNIYAVKEENGTAFKKYVYCITNSGDNMAKTLIKGNPEEYEKIKIFAEKLNTIKQLNYNNLSLAAKTYYILTNEGGRERMSIEKFRDKANKLKWEISRDDLDTAVDILKKLDFI